jgi:hypothetical protein
MPLVDPVEMKGVSSTQPAGEISESSLWNWADPVGVGLSLWPIGTGSSAKKNLVTLLQQKETKTSTEATSTNFPTGSDGQTCETGVIAPQAKERDAELSMQGTSASTSKRKPSVLPHAFQKKRCGPHDAFVCPPAYMAVNPMAKLENVHMSGPSAIGLAHEFTAQDGMEIRQAFFADASGANKNDAAEKKQLLATGGGEGASDSMQQQKKQRRNKACLFIASEVPPTKKNSKCADEKEDCDLVEGMPFSIQNCLVGWGDDSQGRRMHVPWTSQDSSKMAGKHMNKSVDSKQLCEVVAHRLPGVDCQKCLQHLSPVISAIALSLSCKSGRDLLNSWQQMSLADLIEWRGGHKRESQEVKGHPLAKPSLMVRWHALSNY